MKRLAAIYGGTYVHHRTMTEKKYRKYFSDLVYILDLPSTDLNEFDALLIPCYSHRGRLLAARDRFADYLRNGGSVIAFGEQPEPFLPGMDWERRMVNFWWFIEPGATSGLSLSNSDHSLFEYISLKDAEWHYHGVFRPPEGAETLIATEDGAAVLYVDRASVPGTIVATTLDPIGHFGSYFMPAAERFLDGFLPWVKERFMEEIPSEKRSSHV